VLLGELLIVGLGVELTVLGKHETVDWNLFRTNPLTIVLHLGTTVVGLDGVGMKVEDQTGYLL
jgi:hypothetical protein